MGTLPPYSSDPTLLESYAQAINKKGEIVGAVSVAFHLSQVFGEPGAGPGLPGTLCVPNSHAVWYNGSELKDLNKLIPASPGWELNLANGINDDGVIVGSGYYKCFTLKSGSSLAETFSKTSKAVLLTPAGFKPPAAGPAAATSSCPISPGSGD